MAVDIPRGETPPSPPRNDHVPANEPARVEHDGAIWRWVPPTLNPDGSGHDGKWVYVRDVDEDPPTSSNPPGTHSGNVDNPNRDGKRDGQRVRKDGYVWEWDGDRNVWVNKGKVDTRSERNLPHARNALDRDRNGRGGGDGNVGGGGDGGGGNNNGGGGNNGGSGGGDNSNELHGIPAGGELWKVGNDYYVIYRGPGGLPGKPIRMSWRVRGRDELNAITRHGQIKAKRTMTRKEFRDLGIVNFGSSQELETKSKHPWQDFMEGWRESGRYYPHLQNREVLSLYLSEWLETGGEPSMEQLSRTRYYRNRTPEEIAAIEKWAQNGVKNATFRDQMAKLRDDVIDELTTKGFDFSGGNRGRIAQYFATQLIWGKMTWDDFVERAEEISNPFVRGASSSAGVDELPKGFRVVRYNGQLFVRDTRGVDHRLDNAFLEAKYGMDAEKVNKINRGARFSKFLNKRPGLQAEDAGFDSVDGEETVRALVEEWLGPRYADQFSDAEILRWAQRVSENANELQTLEQRLKKRRLTIFGKDKYDEELTWNDIAATWEPVWYDVLGELPDQRDSMFEKVMRSDDREQAEALLRSHGFANKNKHVLDAMRTGLDQKLGDGTVRSGGFFK